jgi:hypothetical protein
MSAVEAAPGLIDMTPYVQNTALAAELAAAGAQPEVPAAVAEPRLSIDALRVRSEELSRQIAADKLWVSTERPTDMGSDLLVAFGITTMDAVRNSRQYAQAHGLAA